MYETYYWFNKPSETVIYCVNCAYEKSENPQEEFNFEDTYPQNSLLCDNCSKDVSK